MANVLDALTLKDTKSGKTTEYEIQDKGARAQIAAQVAASTDENADYAAEVVDARIGADGESYASLGEAIRGQREKSKDEVTQLKGDLAYIEDKIKYGINRYDGKNLTYDKYITASGLIADYIGWILSDYIPIEENTDYVFIISKNIVASNNYYAFFDKNKKYISGGNGGNKINGVAGAKYLRISNASNCFNDFSMIVPYDYYYQSPYEYIPFTMEWKDSKLDQNIERIDQNIERIDQNIERIDQNIERIDQNIERIDQNIEQIKIPNNIKSINRLGISSAYPIQSLLAYKEAYKRGFRTLLCDLCFTSDNVPVCSHDIALNQHYKNVYTKDTHELVDYDTDPKYIHVMTYETLKNNYDFGYYKGSEFAGLSILTLDEMVKFCKYTGCELYIEVKFMRSGNVQSAIDVLKKYNFTNVSWSADSAEIMSWIIQVEPSYRVSTMPTTIDENVISQLNSLKTESNSVFAFMDSSTQITEEMMNMLIGNNIGFEMGTLNTDQAIIDYLSRGEHYNYCTGIESDSVIASNVLLDNIIN